MEDRELVGLLYRADWTRLTLSGTVRGAEPIVDTTFTISEPWVPFGPWRPRGSPPPEPPQWFYPEPEGEGAVRTLLLAPGRQFRVSSADGSRVLGSDGERVWQWLRDVPPEAEVHFDDRPRAPFRALLAPSWLVSGYSLAASGPETVGGRAGVRVRATPRPVTEREPRRRRQARGSMGLVPAFGPRWLRAWDEVDAVVDAELGILLRCSRRRGDQSPLVAEFESLDVGRPAEPSAFSAPPGSVFGRSRARQLRDSSTGESFADTLEAKAREAAKTVAGMAAGGLGAVIRYGPSRNGDPFAQATAEESDPEAAMPTDEPDPDQTPGAEAGAGGPDGLAAAAAPETVSDQILHLLYRSGLPEPQFSATLHQWFDFDALLDAVPQGARGTGFGGVGFLVDALRDSVEDSGGTDLHSVSTVRIGGWTRYRVDVTRPATHAAAGTGRPKRARWGYRPRGMDPRTVVSDGTQRWSVYADRAERGPAAPAPEELADLVDASWLLDCALSGGEEIEVDGWPAYRVVARSRQDKGPFLGWWERLFFPAVAVLDAETGRLVRLTRFKGGRPVIRQELRDISPLPADTDFAFTPPPGMLVDEPHADEDSEPGEDAWSWSPGDTVRDPAREAADAIRKQVDDTVAAARNVLGSFFGGGQRG